MNTVKYGEYVVKSRDVDFKDDIKISALVDVFEDLVAENSKDLKIDIDSVAEYGLKWVITKISAVVKKQLKSHDSIKIATWPKKPSAVKFMRSFKADDENGVRAVDISSVWCVLSRETDKIMPASKVIMPDGAEFSDENTDTAAAPHALSFTDGTLVFDYKFVYGDIDGNRHVNNVAYIRLAENSLSTSEYAGKRLAAFEANFLSQSYEGDEAFVYKKTDGNTVFVSIRVKEKEVFRMAIDFETL